MKVGVWTLESEESELPEMEKTDDGSKGGSWDCGRISGKWQKSAASRRVDRGDRSLPAKTGETSGGDGGSGPPGGWKLVLSIGGKLRERIKADSGAGCGV